MAMFLMVVGAVVVGLVVLALVAAFGFWLYLMFIGRSLAGIGSPPEITLRPLPHSPNAALDERAVAFESAGFTRVSFFAIEEMKGLHLLALMDGAGRVALTYFHPTVGVWSDAVADFADDETLTVSNAPHGSELDHRPGHDKVYDKTSDEAALLVELNERIGDRPLKVVPPEGFVARFESSYRDEQQWRSSRGGPTVDEIRRVADNMDGDFSEEQIHQARSNLATPPDPD